MKKSSAPRRCFHRRRDAPQAQTLQDGALSHRPQKTAGRHIDHAIDECWLVTVSAADRQIAIEQAGGAHEMRLLGFAAGPVEPNALVSAESPQTEFPTDRQMGDLVARKRDACKFDPECPGGAPRGLEIGAKGLNVASLFQAIEMREGVRADLLGRVVQDSPNER